MNASNSNKAHLASQPGSSSLNTHEGLTASAREEVGKEEGKEESTISEEPILVSKLKKVREVLE